MNIILDTDSYKASHWVQYPPNTEYVFSYIESRGSQGDDNIYGRPDKPIRMQETVFFGLQVYLKYLADNPITQEDIDEAEEIFTAHGEPFNREGWQYILDTYDGRLPLQIRAVPEGTVVPTKNVLVTVENTDPACYWLTSYIETGIHRAVWYPTTVATVSWRIKNLIKQYLQETADSTEGLPFKLHDFGARGVSSKESAGLGGMAHLVNFMGTDTVEALMYARKFYEADMPGFSVPAAEHSSITTWGKDREVDAYRNMLRQFAKPGGLVAVVSDSYDIFNASLNIWGKELKDEVIQSGATVVIRPDSGDPTSTVLKVMRNLEEGFGSSVNSKGYRVLNYVRVIQGDGIDERAIKFILEALKLNGFSAENIAFGMGGALLQHSNRDTFKFAMKASAAKIDGEYVDVYKSPISDMGKSSKKGKFTLVFNKETGKIYTGKTGGHPYLEDMMKTVFYNGEVVRTYTFDEVRRNAVVTAVDSNRTLGYPAPSDNYVDES
jgi:nicotinamide phosphoribosyltransferase